MNQKEAIEALGPDMLLEMYKRMLEIRLLEERINLLFLEGKMPGTIHQYIGMEACAVGVCSALQKDDVIASTHRPNGHAVAKGLPLESIMAELYGKTTGCCKGKGGAMHLGDIGRGMLTANAIVAANMPIILGVAMSFKFRKQNRVAVSFFGDGGSNQGAFHEALNMAAVYKVPAVFVCENNRYAASTSIKITTRIENIADRAAAYGLPGEIGDGMDVLQTYACAKKAVDRARRGEGPTLLELKTFRYCGHSRRDTNTYMSPEEKEYWKKKDPIKNFESVLEKAKLLSEEKIKEIRKEINQSLDRAISYAQESPDPTTEDIFRDLYVNMEVPR
jgi:TPP-dependent pyruvate/acetoin dehydrogenase alpha subunit